MISRVATFASSEQMIDAALRAQSTMANEQLQEASGVTSTDYAGLGSASEQVINLQVSVARSASYVSAATSADSKVQVMYSTVGSISDLYTQLRTLLTAASNSATTDSTSVTQSAQQMLQEMTSLLNTQYSGQYLFGGADTQAAPVDTSSATYPAMSSPSTASTSYYQGNDQAASVRVSDGDQISYGVRAGSARFEPGRQQLAAHVVDDNRSA
jgi:flagellar hook-associated protein 3 FlgL